jgi:hypothetical protein
MEQGSINAFINSILWQDSSRKNMFHLATNISVNVPPNVPSLVWDVIRKACEDFAITPFQFLTFISIEDRELIASGNLDAVLLRGYSVSFANGIESGRTKFHPATKHFMCVMQKRSMW